MKPMGKIEQFLKQS